MTKPQRRSAKTKLGKALVDMPAPAPSPPSADEQQRIETARQAVKARAPRVAVKIDTDKSGAMKDFRAHHDDRDGLLYRLQDAFGSRGLSFTSAELNNLVQAAQLTGGQIDETRLNAFLAVVDGIRPANEIEAMLACQLAVTHRLTMDLVRRTHRADQIPQFEANGRLAAKFLSAFAAQVELLNRLQRGPAQTVRLEHVTVHEGGQAIVGNVATGGPRGGGHGKNENQPHAPQLEPGSIAPATGSSLPCPDAQREPVPVAGR